MNSPTAFVLSSPSAYRQIVGHRRDELLPRRDGEVQPERAIVVDHRAERGSRVREERHAADGRVLRLVEAERTHTALEVREPHAVAAAHRHPGAARDRRKPLGERRDALAWLLVAAREDHRAPGAGLRGETELLLEQRVRDREDDEIHRLADLGQRRRRTADPRTSSYFGFTGTIRPSNPPSTSSTTLWLPTEPSRALAPTTATERASSMRSIAVRSPLTRRHRGFLTARSLTAARYACQPGMPFTPPPACVAEEPWYRPLIGVR